jgi:hypothetical protein
MTMWGYSYIEMGQVIYVQDKWISKEKFMEFIRWGLKYTLNFKEINVVGSW